MLTLARKISDADRTTHQGKWNKKQYLGFTLKGKKLGLIGFGNIAKELARDAIALGMKVGVYSRFSKGQVAIDEAKSIGCSIYSSVEDLLKDAQIISLHLPSTSHTENILNEERMKLMRKDAIIINTARGSLIDEKALIKALKNSFEMTKEDAVALAKTVEDIFKGKKEIEDMTIDKYARALFYDLQREKLLKLRREEFKEKGKQMRKYFWSFNDEVIKELAVEKIKKDALFILKDILEVIFWLNFRNGTGECMKMKLKKLELIGFFIFILKLGDLLCQ